MNKQLEKIWEEIEFWNLTHLNESLGSYLNAPATVDVINDLNSRLENKLPDDFLDSLRRHNGTVSWTVKFYEGTLLDAKSILLELDEVRGVAKDLHDANLRDGDNSMDSLICFGPVKNNLWSDYWIPFHVTDWSQTCFDFDPDIGGEMGQVISVNWEGNSIKVIAKNYLEFLRLCANNLPDEIEE
ncbi:SMI1/KNR4 family protein [Undibacterium sp. TC4M20W]|uniref:SMI1/KNR4 family protein n=1 Tax=Undibacterium sp. TC4M20W TaxID=3413052 RepID=UPI003BF2DC5A